MASLALPAWTSSRHPIVLGETRHWQRSRVWRGTRYVLWAGLLVFLAVPLACPLLVNLAQPGFSGPPEAILVTGGTFVFGLAVVSAVASGLNSLLAGLLGATLISRERECQSWPFLRLTTLTSLEIVGGKVTALLRSLAWPMHFALGLRLLTLLAGVLTLALAAAAGGLTLDDVLELWNAFGLSLSLPDWVLLQASILASALVALAWWLAEPYFSVIYNAAIGLAASCLARSRGLGIVLTVALHFGLGLGLYAPVQQLMSLSMVFVLQEPAGVMVELLPLLLFILPLIVQSLLQAAVAALCVVLALNRAERLSE